MGTNVDISIHFIMPPIVMAFGYYYVLFEANAYSDSLLQEARRTRFIHPRYIVGDKTDIYTNSLLFTASFYAALMPFLMYYSRDAYA